MQRMIHEAHIQGAPGICHEPDHTNQQIESKPSIRVDTDQRGDWYVWRRLGVSSGWATFRRCESQEDANSLAEVMNQAPRLEP